MTEEGKTSRDKGALAALTGVGFLVVAIAGFAIDGVVPDPTGDSAKEIIDFYVDNKSSQMVSAALAGLASALLVFFGAYLREVLRTAAGGRDFLATASFAGTLIIAMGAAIDGTITLTLAETADDIDPAAVQALSALFSNDYLPFAVGSFVFLLGTGLSVLGQGAEVDRLGCDSARRDRLDAAWLCRLHRLRNPDRRHRRDPGDAESTGAGRSLGRAAGKRSRIHSGPAGSRRQGRPLVVR